MILQFMNWFVFCFFQQRCCPVYIPLVCSEIQMKYGFILELSESKALTTDKKGQNCSLPPVPSCS